MTQKLFDFTETILRGASRIHRMEVEALAQAEERLTLRQFRTLQRVYEGVTSLSEMSRLAQRSLPTTSETVEGLVRRGMLGRETSPDDRRAVLLSILPRGVAAYRAGADLLARVDAIISEGLDESEYELLQIAMGKVLKNSQERLNVS